MEITNLDRTHRCATCVGTGKIVGLGMVTQHCPTCAGNGRIINESTMTSPVQAPKSIKIDKGSKHYKVAIKNIKALNESITDEEAEAIFAKSYEKLNV